MIHFDLVDLEIKTFLSRPEDLDVKIDGDQLCVTASQDVGGGGRSRVLEQKFSLPSGVRPGDVQSSLTRDGTLVITAVREQQQPAKRNGDNRDASNYSLLEDKLDQVLNPVHWKDEKSCRGASKGEDYDRIQPHQPLVQISRNVPPSEDSVSRVECDADTYRILVNVQQFRPEDLVIKTVDDCVIVEANHEAKTQDGRSYSNKSFSQSFNLPRGMDPESVTSALSKEGVLIISAPLPHDLRCLE